MSKESNARAAMRFRVRAWDVCSATGPAAIVYNNQTERETIVDVGLMVCMGRGVIIIDAEINGRWVEFEPRLVIKETQ